MLCQVYTCEKCSANKLLLQHEEARAVRGTQGQSQTYGRKQRPGEGNEEKGQGFPPLISALFVVSHQTESSQPR